MICLYQNSKYMKTVISLYERYASIKSENVQRH